MDIILIPGLWLDASSWQQVASALEEFGHHPRPLTLPGMESVEADRSDISLQEAVTAVVAEVDRSIGPVMLVAHSA